MIELDKRVADTVARYAMFTPSSRITVAFSGGRDSTALLYLLYEQGYNVCAVHVHHGIRGAEADRDEVFCRNFCEKLAIPYMCERFDVPTLAGQRGQGIEECARSVRYEAFDRLLESGETDCVATAHHARDNLETVLYNIARGSGLVGICGIPPVRGGYARPMIDAAPCEIDKYVETRGLEYVCDSTNTDIIYMRNRIRAQVIPPLETVNTALYEHVSALSRDCREDSEYLDGIARSEMSDDISSLRSLAKPILSRVLVMLWSGYSERTLARVHVDALRCLVLSGKNGSRLCLPDGQAYIENGKLCFGDFCRKKEFRYELVCGENYFPDLDCMIFLSNGTENKEKIDSFTNIYKKLIYTQVNSDKINKVYIRSLCDGDKYRALGMTRTVRKLIASDRLSGAERARLPIFCDDNGILWVPGHGVRDGAWAQDGLHIYFFSGEKH